jgi:hypothetical protein
MKFKLDGKPSNQNIKNLTMYPQDVINIYIVLQKRINRILPFLVSSSEHLLGWNFLPGILALISVKAV